MTKLYVAGTKTKNHAPEIKEKWRYVYHTLSAPSELILVHVVWFQFSWLIKIPCCYMLRRIGLAF